MKQITLQAIEVRQDGMSLLITKMKAGDLADFTVIHRYDANKKPDDPTQGYQRPAEMPRVKNSQTTCEQKKNLVEKLESQLP